MGKRAGEVAFQTFATKLPKQMKKLKENDTEPTKLEQRDDRDLKNQLNVAPRYDRVEEA